MKMCAPENNEHEEGDRPDGPLDLCIQVFRDSRRFLSYAA